MEIISGNLDFCMETTGNAVTVGKFDGIHRGHKKIMRRMMELARERGTKSVVVTFDVSPNKRLHKELEGNLFSRQERIRILSELGVDYLIEYPFTEEVMHMSPEEFVQRLLVDGLHAGAVVVGNDFRFAYKREGDIPTLVSLGQKYDFIVEALEKETLEDVVISSTEIRRAVSEGNIQLANRMLGHRYFTLGEVKKGKQLGRTLGMPTINQHPTNDKLLPPFGVYASCLSIDGRKYRGVTNIGIRPTVSEEKSITVETNILDYSGDLYGRELLVEFLDYLRPEMRFSGVDALASQMKEDREHSRAFTENEVSMDLDFDAKEAEKEET